MAEISGLAGGVNIGTTLGTLTFRSWTISYTQATVDTTTFADGTRTRVPGILEWSGSAEALLDGTTAPALPTAAIAATVATFSADADKTWKGSIIITGLTPAVVVDGEATCTVTFDGSGTLTPA